VKQCDDRITIIGKWFQGNTHNDENERKTCQQNSQRYLNTVITIASLISLFVCLIPTTIGGLLSAIGIAGICQQNSQRYLIRGFLT